MDSIRQKLSFTRLLVWSFWLFIVSFSLPSAFAAAGTDTWLGNTDTNWATGANWNPATNAPPTSSGTTGDSLVFGIAGSSGASLSNNIAAGLTMGSSATNTAITFGSTASAYTFTGNNINFSGGVLNNSTANQTINLNANFNGGYDYIFTTTTGGGNITYGGVMSGMSSTRALIVAGSGIMYITNFNNSFAGKLCATNTAIINVAGLNNYGVNGPLGNRSLASDTGSGTAMGLIFNGGTFQYTGTNPQISNRMIRLATGAIDASGTGLGTVCFSAPVSSNLFASAANRILTLTGSNTGTNTFACRLEDGDGGSSSLVKTGTGTWIYSGNNNLLANSGTIAVNAGTLVVNGNNSIRSGGTTVSKTATLQLQADSDNTSAGLCTALSASQNMTLDDGGTLQLRGDNSVTFTGGDNMQGLGFATIDIDVNNLSTGTGNTLTFAANGFDILATTIDVTGGNGYTLGLGILTNITSASALTLVPTTANLTLGGYTTTAGSGTASLILDGTNTASSVTGPIANGISVPIAVTKQNSSIWTLTGINNYSGNTTISSGTLALSGNGSIASTPDIIIAGGATLDVSLLASTFTLGSTQTLANSSSTALINAGVNGFNTGSGTLSLKFASGTTSFNITNGAFNLAASTVVTVDNTGASLTPGNYKIISKSASGNAGSVAGTMPTLVLVTGAGASAPASLQVVNGELYLAISSNSVVKTTCSISSSTNNEPYGTPVIFMSVVSPAPPDGESVVFMDGNTTLGTETLVSGVATYTNSTIPAGTNSITASYGGDASNGASTSSPLILIIPGTTTTCTLTSSINNEPYATTVVFTGTVSPAPPNGETVTFMDGPNALGTGNLSSGVATFATSDFATGTNSMTAVYAGDGTYAASTSPVLNQIVTNTATLQYLTITNDGLVRDFIVYTPSNLPAGSCPLLLVLHGYNGDGENMMVDTTDYRFNQLADTNNFIVVYPFGMSNEWRDCRADSHYATPADDVEFLSALLDYIGTLHPVDTNRVYAAGHSNGAMMCLCLAMNLPGRFAAICANCGSLAGVTSCTNLSYPISLLYCMGTADPIMPFNGGYINVSPPYAGTVLPASATVALWTNTFSIPPSAEAVNTFPNIVPTDDSTVTEYDYQRVQDGTELVYLQVNGGGHGWPGPIQFGPSKITSNGMKNQDISLCDLAWEFFQRHTLNGPPLQLSKTPSANMLQLGWNWGVVQATTNFFNWNNLTANKPTNTAATGLTNILHSSGGENLSPTNIPLIDSSEFFRLQSP